MYKIIFMSILVALSGSLLCGCIASERDMSTLKLQLKELNTTLAQMQSNQAELASKMEELNQNLSISNENFSQMDGQFSAIATKVDDLSAMLKNNSEEKSQPILPSDLFTEAKTLLDKGAYEQAVTGFKIYLSKYEDNEQADQAYLGMGDAYSALAQHKQAAIAYATLLQKYPQSKLIPSARLKYAISIIPLGKTEEAKRYLSSIVKEFPSAPEALQAKAELAKIK